MRFYWSTSSEGDRLAWPIFLLLLTVLVPSVGVVWMMREAVENERLAANQRLEEAYEAQLATAGKTLTDRWQSMIISRLEATRELPPQLRFATLVEAEPIDSVIILGTDSKVLYPTVHPPELEYATKLEDEWELAGYYEFQQNDDARAAETYKAIAKKATRLSEKARANLAEIRTLLRAKKVDEAIKRLQGMRGQAGGVDDLGRSYPILAELRLLDLLSKDSVDWTEVANSLANRLGAYDQPISSAQRRFAWGELAKKWSAFKLSKQQLGEELAAQFLRIAFQGEKALEGLHPTKVPDLYQLGFENTNVIVLVKSSTLRNQAEKLLSKLVTPQGVSYTLRRQEKEYSSIKKILLSGPLEGWQLGLVATGDDPFGINAEQRQTVHFWIAILILAVTTWFAWLLWRTLHYRLKLARLKNDLVATVSHELKTPLASIRLLVDTLLEASSDELSLITSEPSQSPIHVREYLELISHENSRLTRLIDKFLTFSRIEQGNQRFDLQTLKVSEIVDKAVAQFVEQREVDEQILVIKPAIEANVFGDREALVLALVNLLENAWKYSGDNKRIEISTNQTDGYVAICVKDNGIGLSNFAKKRVFDKFYQVDQRVARTAEGCGLGLSIVSSILKQHGGEVSVNSKQGVGSAFTLLLKSESLQSEDKKAMQG